MRVEITTKATLQRSVPIGHRGTNDGEKPFKGDRAIISDAGKTLAAKETARQDRVSAVKERVKNDFYDQPQILEKIADALLNSGVVINDITSG